MALKNVFGDLGLEGTLRQILRAVTYPRDSGDRMRTIVDGGSISVSGAVTVNAANQATSLTVNSPFSQNSWNAGDIREEYMSLSHNNFQTTRNRWIIT
jgi:hypothetical protein